MTMTRKAGATRNATYETLPRKREQVPASGCFSAMAMNTSANTVSYHATVITGMERLAGEEIQEKLKCQPIVNQGHVRFDSEADPADVIRLRSVDNVYAVVGRQKLDQMPQNEDELKVKLQLFHDSVNWRSGLTAWRKVTGFDKSDEDTILTRLKISGDEDEAAADPEKERKPKFRVTCYRAGDGHGFQSGEAACVMGGIINDTFGWPVSMKEFDLEVVLFVKDKEWSLSLCLTKDSLHRRNLISLGVTTLRATVCYSMLRLAELQPGDIVCDPLAGTGAILIESAIVFPHTFGLCADHHNVAIQHCFENTSAIGAESKNGPTGVVQFDSTKMPLRTGSMDVIVTDMPFGKRIGTKTMNRDLYPKLVREMSRIVRPCTGRAILLTQDYKNLQMVLESDFTRKCWKMRAKMFLKLGNLSTYIYCLKRTPYVIS